MRLPFRKKQGTEQGSDADSKEEKRVELELEKEGSDLSPEQLAALELQGGVSTVKKISILSLWRYATPLEKTLNVVGLFAAVAAGVAQPALTISFGSLTTNFTNLVTASALSDETAAIRQQFLDNVDRNLKILVGIGAGMFVMTYVYSTIWQITGERISRRIREKYLAGCLRQNIGYIETVGAGEVSTRITTDTNLFQAGISEKVPMLVQFISMFFAGFVIAFVVNWRITIVLLSILPAIILAGAVMGAVTNKAKQKSLEHLSTAGNLAEEAISSVKTVQAFGTQERLVQLYDVPNVLAWRQGQRFGLGTAVGVGVFFMIVYSSYALAFFWGTTVYLQGNSTVGNIITAFFSVIIGAFSLSEAPPMITAIISASSAAAKLYAVIERVPPIDSEDTNGRILSKEQLKGRLELRNVAFRYPGRPAVPVLRDLTLDFPAGQTAALVGASGCGKTSCITLLLRFYDPLAGQVLLDGVPLTELNLRWLRSQIGFVSQEPTLFSTSVFQNVAHGLVNTPLEHASEEVKRQLVSEACIKANADAFVRSLPEGYETKIGERGLLLSGGQRQRIAIARAIVSDPIILLLDEATSALDSKSEKIVQDALDKASEGRTTIAVAHRLSTIRKAHQIHVIASGERIESGTHRELLDQGGAYARLVNAQRIRELNEVDDESETDSIIVKELADDEKYVPQPLNRQVSVASEVLQKQPLAIKKRKYSVPTCFRRFFAMNKSQWRLYILAVCSSTLLGCVYPVFSIIFGHIISVYTQTDPQSIRSDANRYAGYLFAIACVSWPAMTFAITGWNLSAEALARYLRRETLRATLKQDITFFDEEENSTGTLTSSISDSAEKVIAMLGSTGGVIVQGLVTLLVGTIVGLVYSWQIALVGFSLLPFTLSVGIIRLYVVIMKDTRNEAAHAKSAQLACESAAAVRTVAALTREADVVRLYSKELDEPEARTIRFAIWGNLLYSFSQASSFWVISLIFWYGSRLLVDGKISVTGFYIALEAVVFGAIEVGNIFVHTPDASKFHLAATYILRMLDSRPVIDADSPEGERLERTDGEIAISDVHFRYKTRPFVPVLRGLSLDIKPGTFVALVGPSGCGKSTVISLLERFYDPLTGSIRLDGREVPTLNVSNYRSFISLVAQESALYAGSVRTNVLLGSAKTAEEVTQPELEEACKAANIHDFVVSLPDGYETDLGGKGAQLSGGQRQRIALARALIRRPPILLLDEATSALDSESEKVVQRALDDAARGRSTIAVAHRLSTIKQATCIYCVEAGRIIEAGTHDELYAKRGIYYELVNQQSLER